LPTVSTDDVWQREQEFHDRLAGEFSADDPPAVPDHLELALFDRLGDLAGKRVLELGCGTGDLTLQLLERGAHVTAVDISPGMVDVARRRAERFRPGTTSAWQAAPVEATGLPGGTFDVVTGKWILHHVDFPAAVAEVHRLLDADGRGVFIENQLTNPALRVARERLVGRFGIPRYGTDDEHPLKAADYELLRRTFTHVDLDYPDFFFFTLVDRQLAKQKSAAFTRLMRGADDLLYRRAPAVARYSFHVIVDVTR
jgi:SAM-dependent methyltransferase